MKPRVFLGLVVSAGLLVTACSSISQIGTSVAVATGQISPGQAAAINQSAQAVQQSFQDFTPEQEYYIGRSVAAVILTKYRPYDDPAATRYINLLGQSLAMASDRPETFKGYHFLILDSDDINALSAPGGFVFVTRGLLRCAKNEDQVAAILCHEITHVVLKHGLQAIKKSRITSALTNAALTGVEVAGPSDVAQLTATFSDSINDITSTMINSGYSREFEVQADRGAVDLMKRVGYDPWALVDVLEVMKLRLKPGGNDFAKTHPDPAFRIEVVEKEIGSAQRSTAVNPERQARYEAAMAGI